MIRRAHAKLEYREPFFSIFHHFFHCGPICLILSHSPPLFPSLNMVTSTPSNSLAHNQLEGQVPPFAPNSIDSKYNANHPPKTISHPIYTSMAIISFSLKPSRKAHHLHHHNHSPPIYSSHCLSPQDILSHAATDHQAMQLEENPVISSLLHRAAPGDRRLKKNGRFLHMFKLFSLLSSGCKVVALLGRPRKAILSNSLITCTLFGYRRGRVSLAIQEDPKLSPNFVIELPILTNALHKEMASGLVRIALESETRTHRKKLLDELIWAVYCNGRKIGYSIRRKQTSYDVVHVMQLLRGVSMGAGVLPCPTEKESVDGELTYMRARFERVVGSKDAEALYIVNPDGTGGPELSIFFVRVQ